MSLLRKACIAPNHHKKLFEETRGGLEILNGTIKVSNLVEKKVERIAILKQSMHGAICFHLKML